MASAPPTRILLHGASGRMGREILRLAPEDATVALVAGYARRADAGAGITALEALASAPAFDVAIDFSRPDGLGELVRLCRERGAALVTGTTGLGPDQAALLDAASADIAVMHAANFSLGIAVLEALVERAARALPGWDLDIVEAHHSGKQDAPSGTALLLGAAAGRGRGDAALASRPVRYASLRCGDIVGEHTVQLAGQGERLELVHRATDRAIFARGALAAATRLARMPPGRYRMADLLTAD